MGTPHPPEEALLFLALLYSSRDALDRARPVIKKQFGDILFESPESPWDHSHYYDDELGSPVMRQFLFFCDRYDASLLPETKLDAISLEKAFSCGEKRRINIDPGYVTSSKVILASAKDYSHRLYLGKGIYGEVALYYRGNGFHPMPYTYHDYRDQKGIEIFEKARKELKKISACLRQAPGCRGESPRRNT